MSYRAFRRLPCLILRLPKKPGYCLPITLRVNLHRAFMDVQPPTPIAVASLEADSAYQYTPITGEGDVRILTLYPGRGDEPLVGELTTENLAAAQPYEAVSYVWGPGARRKSLICSSNGRYLPLTQSIHDTLSCIRDPDRPRRLWADQICINQDDVVERSHQVTLMNAIYQGAAKVLVWLGPDDEDAAEEAIGMVKYLNGVFEDEEAHRIFKRAHSEGLGSQSEEPWVPLSKLTKQPWFTRLWIVQEIGTSTPATLFWGKSQVDWEQLSFVAGVLNVHYHYLRTKFSIFTPNIRYLYQRFVEPHEATDDHHNRSNFVYELHRARHLQSKDPRDHVYGFLGHFSIRKGGAALAGLRPDYRKSVEDVFIDVAIRGLTGASCLILLSACHNVSFPNLTGRTKKMALNLPSWVPDWRVLPLHLLGSPSTPHRASGSTTPRLEIGESKRTLRIFGVRFGTVQKHWWTFHGNAFQFRSSAKKYPAPTKLPIDTLWRDICGHDEFGLDARYVTGEPAFFALAQTLTNGCIGVDRTRKYEDIPQKEWLCGAAAYLARAKVDEPHRNVSPELRALAPAGDSFKWSHEATLVTRYRRFAITDQGYYVLGPDIMREGDVLVVFYGGRVPYMLRPLYGNKWQLLGECYVHGMMNGEALKGKVQEEGFSIR